MPRRRRAEVREILPDALYNSTLAEKFINFILSPKAGAQLANFTQFSSPNQAALPLLDARDLKNPALYPDGEVAARLEYVQNLGAKSRLYDEIWTQIKAR